MRKKRKDNIGSIFGSVFAILFAIIWIFIVGRIARFMIVFGLLFIGIAIFNIVRVIKSNKISKYNFGYDEEVNEETYNAFESYKDKNSKHATYCPFCGTTAKMTDRFCKKCGTKLK